MFARKPSRMIVLLISFAGLIYLTSTIAQTRVSNRSTATIINSSTTNNDGYRIVLTRSGDVTYTREAADDNGIPSSSTINTKIPVELANKFFNHLDAAMPVSALPREECARNDSLGSTTYVTVDGQRSPDLGCASDPRKTDLYDDVTLIAAAFASKDIAPELPGENPPNRTIGISADNTTVHLKVGEIFALRLGTAYTWALAGMDQAILDQQDNPKGPSGTQAIFKAASVGKSDLRAVGDPHCTTPKTNCAPTRNFKVTIIVDKQ